MSLVIGLAASACSSTKHTGDNTGSTGGGTGGSTAASSAPAGGAIGPDTTPRKKGGTVTIVNEQGQTWPCQFNPFNTAVYAEANGFVYEPLVYVNIMNNGAETPMLAKSYQWNADKTSVTFTVRDGVKWSDGQPFTADDVAFTFNLMKQTPSTDLYSLWAASGGAGLQSATATGDQVTLTFKQNAQVYFYTFADQVQIVPKHIFGSGDAAAHPDTWANPNPVGTGPFIPKCTPNNIEYTANPTYWQPGKPYIQKLEYPAYLDNNPANQDLASGKGQWGGQFITGIKAFYLDKSANNHTWSPPVANNALYPNLDPSKSSPTSKLAVRQAISMTLDRNKISVIGEDGQEPPANQSGIISPTFKQYYDAAAVAAAGFDKPNLDKAKTLMQSAGYSSSSPLNLNVITITGYTDWDASLNVVKSELKDIGINLTVQDLAQGDFQTKLLNGQFDLAYYGQAVFGPSPYYELRNVLDSNNTAPVGQPANGNYERYKNPAVDSLFDQYATASADQQVSIVKQIGQAMLTDLPIIPVTASVDWYQWNDKDIQGWPTQSNPYAQPSVNNWPDLEQVLTNIYSKSAQS
jgi:peptide/nickel transport system substrate-binding protein